MPPSLAPSSRGASVCSLPERVRLLTELGSRAVPTWAALEARPGGRTQLVIVERLARAAYSEAEISEWGRKAEHLAKVVHPNLSRVRDVVRTAEDVLVVSDFVDGVTWGKLTSCPRTPPLEMALRVLIDVLSGLGSLHTLRAAGQPLKLLHGAIKPDSIVVGTDGVARILNPCTLRSAEQRPGRSCAYLAPEILLADDSADARADLYSVGALLWEALSGRSLFADMQASAIVTQVLSGRPGRPPVSSVNSWAEPLADVVARAMAAEPDKRFASAASFAAELRRVGGLRLMPQPKVAAWMQEVHGDVVRLRHEALERGGLRPPDVSGIVPQPASADEEASIDVIIDRPSTAPTPLLPAAPSLRQDPHESQVLRVATKQPAATELVRRASNIGVGSRLAAPRAMEPSPAEPEFERIRAPSPFEPLTFPQAPLVPKGLEHALPPPPVDAKPPAKGASPPPLPVGRREVEAPVRECDTRAYSSLPVVSTPSSRGLVPRRAIVTLALAVVGALLLFWLLLPSSQETSPGSANSVRGLVFSAQSAHSPTVTPGPASSLTSLEEQSVQPPIAVTNDGPPRTSGPASTRSVRARVGPAKKYEPEGI